MNTAPHQWFASARYFVMVAASALSISFIVARIVYGLGIPTEIGEYIRLNLFVTACIAVPTALIAALHDYRVRSYQRRIEALAWTDELTGLLNRRFFRRVAEEEAGRMRRTGHGAVLAFVDLDHFKHVNDRHGHAAGDALLVAVAEAMHSELRRPFDKLGRWGGEEFIVLLSHITPEQAAQVCHRLRARIASTVCDIGGQQISVTASIGAAVFAADTPFDEVIEAADKALYEAKVKGRDRVSFAETLRIAPPAQRRAARAA